MRSLLLFALAIAASLGALGGPPATGEGSSVRDRWYGRRIASVSIRGDGPINEPYARKIVPLRAGESLTQNGVRETIRNLYATQWFSDLWIEVGGEEGADVVIAFSAAPRIRNLRIDGPGIPSRSRLLDEIGLVRADFWDLERGKAAEATIVRFLRERGFFEAKVMPEVETAPDGVSVDVRFVVVTGPRAATGTPFFTGSLGSLPVVALLQAAKLKTGKAYLQQTARRDAERFVDLYREKGFARAEVRFESDRYDAEKRLATATYAVFAGPVLVLSVEGAAAKEIRRHPGAPWSKGEPPDEESIRKFADLLRRQYQEKGHARAKVDVTFAATETEERVSFRIQKGERYAIADVSVKGNHALTSRQLLRLLATKPRGLATGGRLVDAEMASDRAALESAYRSRGFADVKTLAPVVRDALSPFMLDVVFGVEEGVRTVVGDRVVAGIVSLPLSDFERKLTVKVGEPYRPSNVDSDVALLRSLLSERGFVEAQVNASVTQLEGTPEEPSRVAVKIEVFEGEALHVGKTIVRGNRRTRLGEIERELAYKEGDPLSYAKIAETQQRLARLGIFQRIDVTSLPPQPGSGTVPLLLSVSEVKPWSLLYGLGAEYDSVTQKQLNLRLSLGVSYYNLFGGAITASGEARYSQRDTRLLGTLRKRSLFEDWGPLSLTVFRAQQVLPNFSIFRIGTFVELERRLAEKTRGTFRYQYEIVEPTADDPSILSSLERQDQKIAISSIGAGLIRDTRDDLVAPRRGWFLLTDAKYAFPLFRADARFVKLQAQVATFVPAAKTVLAFSLRAGAIASLVQCNPELNPTCSPNLDIPIAERLFAGGRTTHRAFPLDNLGIEGSTLKDGQGIGGNAMIVANVEWRVPVWGDLGVALLFDVGTVWASPDRVRMRDLRLGTGIGLSYATPVGPIRLEYGVKLDRKPGEDAGALNFSIGYPF